MATGSRPEGKKPPTKRAKTRATARKAPPRGGGKAGKKAAGKVSSPRGIPPLPMLAAWIAAVAVLLSIIYFSGVSGRRPETRKLDTHKPENHIGMTAGRGASEAPAPGAVHDSSQKEPKPAGAVAGKSTHQVDMRQSGENGSESGRKSEVPGSGKTARQIDAHGPGGNGAEPGKKPESTEPARLPAGPTIPPKPVFSSRDLPPDPAPSRDLLALNRPTPVRPSVPPPSTQPVLARAAIVIDDLGPDVEVVRKLLSLPFPVTFSVMPFQSHSTEVAELVHSHGGEVMLHLPMEPLGYPKKDPGKGALMASMSEEAIRRGVGDALSASPYFRGVNNHMGSRMTEDARAMKTVIDEVNRRGLFFLDSLTSPRSRGLSAARELNCPSRKRDIFLDHNASLDSVRSQVSRFIRIARLQGTALAIGHPHETTLKALREAAGQFSKNGIKIVPASELMNRQ
ncbi:MAG: divergent polysaccharide deacetylase family protein [Syntrophobacter sp.]